MFLLFSLKRLSQKDAGDEPAHTKENGINLCQILRVAKLKYVIALIEVMVAVTCRDCRVLIKLFVLSQLCRFLQRATSICSQDWSCFEQSLWF